eukprot:1146853-Pelagomonas_calceolata.AAC.1
MCDYVGLQGFQGVGLKPKALADRLMLAKKGIRKKRKAKLRRQRKLSLHQLRKNKVSVWKLCGRRTYDPAGKLSAQLTSWIISPPLYGQHLQAVGTKSKPIHTEQNDQEA